MKVLAISYGFSSEHFESQSEHTSHCCHICVLHLSFCFVCAWISGSLCKSPGQQWLECKCCCCGEMNSLWKLLMAPIYKFLSMFHGLEVLLYILRVLLKGRQMCRIMCFIFVSDSTEIHQTFILTNSCRKYGVISITLKMLIRNAWNVPTTSFSNFPQR